MTSPKIAIIGAGPGGLTLARLLQQASIQATIFEAEPSRSTRSQGGTLDLHPRAGQLALKEAGLIDIFNRHARPEGEATKIVAFGGQVLWDDNAVVDVDAGETHDRGRPEIDRVVLRDLLLDSIAEGGVRWGMKVKSVTEGTGVGKWDVNFADETSETGFDLVVGADGAWSKVRPLLTDAKPFYSGISMLELWSLDVEAKNQWLSSYVGKGSVFSFDEGRAVICQRQGNGSIRSYVGLRKPETWFEDEGIVGMDPAALRTRIVAEELKGAGEDLKRIVTESKDELIPRKLFMLPVGVKWETRAGVTLLGDAAHLMTPFAGVGVNVAMTDALDLAKALTAKKDDISAAIKEYESEMFVRGTKNAQKTEKNLHHHFSAGGGEARAAQLKQHFEMKAAAKAGKTV